MWRVTRRALAANKIRFILTTFTVFLGVAFVVASFVVADSLRDTFGELATDVNEGKDLIVRGAVAAGDRDFGAPAVDEALVEQVAAIPGIDQVEGELFVLGTVAIDDNGDPMETFGPPIAGVNWGDLTDLNQWYLTEGERPAADEFAVDLESFGEYEFTIGNTYTVVTPAYGPREFRLSGVVQFGEEENKSAGTRFVAFDTPTAQDVLGYPGAFNEIWISLQDGADREAIQDQIAGLLPGDNEVVTAEVATEEFEDSFREFLDPFGIALLVFAVVILFVSAFLVNNVFNIVLGQRLRELALLRAVGATGRQIRRSVIAESLAVGVTATAAGILFGWLLGGGILGLFNALGFSFPKGSLPMRPRTIIVAAILGIGFTAVSSFVPARKAGRIPPIAALGQDTRLEPTSTRRRTIVGLVMAAFGILLTAQGMFASFDETSAQLSTLGLGAAILFLAVGVLSPLIARPVALALGRPIARAFGTAGRLARLNAARTPRRTAATAVVLTIGLALVSLVAVVASSIITSFRSTLATSVDAEFVFTDASFSGFPSALVDELKQLPELDAVIGFQQGSMLIDGDEETVTALDLAALPIAMDIDVQEGSLDAVGTSGVAIHEDVADERSLSAGDPVTITYQNGVEVAQEIAAIYGDDSIVGSYVVDLTQFDPNTDGSLFFWAFGKIDDSVNPAQARAAISAITDNYPQIDVEDQSEFLDSQAAQFNNILIIVYVFLGFALIVALFGIALTLILSVYERTREIGLLRAVGMSRRETKRMIRWEAVIIAAFGAVLGLVLGSVLGVALASAMPESFINTIDMPFGQLIMFFVLVIVFTLVAAIFPARRVGQLNVLDAISRD